MVHFFDRYFLVLFLCVATTVSSITRGAPTVHVIPHSHCDPGYHDSFQVLFTKYAKSIIDTVLEALQEDPGKRFVWEEVSFLSLWWQQASQQQKDAMRKLHAVGQLEFIGGGWVMHDEADTSLRGVLNQMTEGLLFLNTTLGVRPNIGWHIDPFGHSSYTPQLYSLLNYDMFVLNRIPDNIKQSMKSSQGLEFFWHNPHFNRTIFAHVLDSHYSTPLIIGLTTEEKARSLFDTCQQRLQWFKTDQLLLPFGNDFHFQNAPSDFKEMDEILKYISQHKTDFGNITIQYSTLSDYLYAVSASNASFGSRNDDFFPYIACSPCLSEDCGGISGRLTIPCGISDSYWSGFYTSKPVLKLLVRELEASLHALEQLNVLHPDLSDNLAESLRYARNNSALLQHHDAITGTSYPDCYSDYVKRMETVLEVSANAIASLKSSVLCGINASKAPVLEVDSTAVISGLNANNRVAVVVQNSLEKIRDTYLRISLPDGLCVKAMNGSHELLSQIVDNVLYVVVTLQPAAVEVLWLEKIQCLQNKPHHSFSFGENVEISNKYQKLQFNDSGHLTSWADLTTGITYSITHLFLQAAEKEGLDDGNVCGGSNVYTFVPDNGISTLTPKAIPITVTANGPLVWEVHQQINTYINTTWRLFAPLTNSTIGSSIFTSFTELQTKVGPLPAEPLNSVLSRLSIESESATSFTTYAGGYYPVERSYKSVSLLQANTYPLVGRAVLPLRGSGQNMALITLRPMALSTDGTSLDLMLHRRIKLLEDKRGDDTSVMDDPILIGFLPSNSSDVLTAHAMREHRNPPTLHYSLVNSTSEWTSLCHSQWLPLTPSPLPHAVQSHSIRLLKQVSSSEIEVGIRLINVDESESRTIDLSSVFKQWTLLQWTNTTPDFLQITSPSGSMPKTSMIYLEPLEMRSLVLYLQRTALDKKMAEIRRQAGWEKARKFQPVVAGGKKGGQPQVLKQTPLPHTKPKPVRNAPKKTNTEKIKTTPKSEYAELRPVRSDSIDHYADLCVTTRTSQSQLGSSSAGGDGTGKERGGNDDNERHYSNVPQTKHRITPAYENHQIPKSDGKDKENAKEKNAKQVEADDSTKHSQNKQDFCHSNRKLILGLVMGGMLVMLLGLILLSIAIAGLSGASHNSRRLQELENNVSKTAQVIQQMETDVSVTKMSVFTLRSETGRLNERADTTDSAISRQKREIDEEISQLEQRINTLVNAQEVNINETIAQLNDTIDRLTVALQNDITLNAMNIMELVQSLEDVSERIQLLNETSKQLQSFAIPIVNCNSYVYQGLRVNGTVAHSPTRTYTEQLQDSLQINCGAALYSNEEMVAYSVNNTISTSLKKLTSNRYQCICQLLSGSITNTMLECTMTVTQCTV